MRLYKLIKIQFQIILSWLTNMDMGVDSPYWRNQMEFEVLHNKKKRYFERKHKRLQQKEMLKRQKRLA